MKINQQLGTLRQQRRRQQEKRRRSKVIIPDGHFKLPHLWPVKLPHGGRPDYDDSAAMAMRAAASLSR